MYNLMQFLSIFLFSLFFLFFLSFFKVTQQFVDYVILSLIIVSTLITIYFAYIMHDTKYIKKNVNPFILEMLLIGFITIVLFVCIYHLRKINIEFTDYLNFIGIGLFFMLIHGLFELCGLYHKL